MSKDASIAPKERVNIVYRPAEGEGKEEVELPLKLLVIGDFTGTRHDRPIEKREPVAIDKDNFNDVMKGQSITLDLDVPNCFTGNPDDALSVSLNIDSLSDFSPDSIVQQVPELKRMLELREALCALRGPVSNIPEFRRKVHELVSDDATRTKLLTEMGIEEG